MFSVCLLVLGASITGIASDVENGESDVTANEYQIIFEQKEYVYTGSEITPEVIVAKVDENGDVLQDTVLIQNEDYVVTYNNNIAVGTAVIVVEGIGSYSGLIEMEQEFTIVLGNLKDAEITLSSKSYTYDGEEKKPSIVVELGGVVLEEVCYSVNYINADEAGTAYVIVSGEGDYTGSVKIAYEIKLKKPAVSLSKSYNRVNVKWNDVKGAHAYQIYRSTSKDSGYKRIATVNSVDDTVYVDKNVSLGVRYYYKIRAYRTVDDKKVYSSYSSIKNVVVRVATPTVKSVLRTSYNSLEIKWSTVSGATGYRLYRSTSEDGKYEQVKTLAGNDNTTYVDKGLVCGRTYYYKVRAYRKVDGTKYFGLFANPEGNYTRPAKAKIKDSTSFDATTISLKWNKPAGADGYQIWRSTSKDGEYTKVKTISSGDTLSWKDTELSKTSNYYYKVRAYCKTDGKTRYGKYSDVFTKRKAGWRYVKYNGETLKIYYNAKGEKVKDVRNRIGKQDSYYIKVNKQKCVVTVYAKDGDKGYIIPVVSFVCSPGQSTPVGTFYTPAKYRWRELMGPCWGQWCTRIVNGFLFHSVFYNSYNNNDSLSVGAYNKLGTICSHGCVRVTAGDAKWIYDNCPLDTKVTIYNSSAPGPFGKPSAVKLPYWHTWDPTDPNKFAKCDARGCH